MASISNVSNKLKASRVEQQSLNGQETFFFSFKKDVIKLDFAYFPFPHLGKFKKIGKLNLSSVEDICINKVHAITTRNKARDYLDLCLCMRYLKWGSKDLIKNYRLKFDVNLAPEQLATSFTNVLDAQDEPLFLGKMSKEEIKNYFLKQTELLKKDILS